MFDFDDIWSRKARAFGITYTRYADDLYFSTNRPYILQDLLSRLKSYLSVPRQPTLVINDGKTAFSSRKRRRLAAGLVLTSDRKISIGRPKKRELRAQVFQLKNGTLPPERRASLRGWIAYVRSVEPSFIEALQRKYALDLSVQNIWEE
jgi:RNA-directed DNA polymerase